MKGVGCYVLRPSDFDATSFDQELQQQLVIETRNLKKTRNFYQKLLQQERKNKGRSTIQTLKRKNICLDYCRCIQLLF